MDMEFDITIHVRKAGNCYEAEMELAEGLFDEHLADLHFVLASLSNKLAAGGRFSAQVTELSVKDTNA